MSSVVEKKFINIGEDGTYSIDSGLPEFGYELISTIPYAYSLYKKGKLKSTSSGKDTQCLYWFSENHKEVHEKRSWNNVLALRDSDFPNMHIHSSQLDWDNFVPPPFNDYYKSKSIKFSRQTIVICNRMNDEWNGDPVNFLDNSTLEKLFALLSHRYEIVYIDPFMFGSDYEDHASFNFQDVSLLLKKYSVKTFSQLRNEYSGISVNELQCMLYAGCERFISSNGGLGILCSYFGGENIIYTKMCRELDKDVNSFHAWYSRFSKSIVSVVSKEVDLLVLVEEKWVKDKPLLNIVIRTSGRPNYFHDCIKSIKRQNYINVNIIVGYDEPDSMKYIQGQPCTAIALKKYDGPEKKKPEGEEYGLWFPFNSYFNELLAYVNKGFVIYLDDDDCFDDTNALSKLAEAIEENGSDVVFWRVRFPNRVVPSDLNWVKKIPVCRDMSTIGFCHAASLRPLWEPWKRGDYRVAKYIYDRSNSVLWFDELLTGLQRVKQDGYGLRDDKLSVDISSLPPICVIITAFNSVATLERCLDSVMSQRGLQNELKIIVGVDGCRETLAVAKKLTRKYKENCKFYFSKRNVGTYVLKNSLLAKVVDRDSLVYFLDSDDMLPANFMASYLRNYLETKPELLKVLSLNVDEKDLSEAYRSVVEQTNRDLGESREIINLIKLGKKKDALNLALRKIILVGSDTWCGIYLSILRGITLRERCLSKKLVFKPVTRFPHESFFALYSTLEKVNFFNKYCVAQDTDFFKRSKFLNIVIHSPDRARTFSYLLRSENKESLTQNNFYGIGSTERNKIIEINRRKIEGGNFLGDATKTDILPIL